MFEHSLSTGGSRFSQTWFDIKSAFSRHEIWWYSAYSEIKLRYRRSIIGPFWMTLNMLIIVMCMGMLYGVLFKQDLAEFLPYVAAGQLTWGLISTFVLDGCKAFMSMQDTIRNTNMPLFSYVLRDVAKNFLVFLHTVIVIPLMYLVWPAHVTPYLVLALPALLILIVNGLWVGTLLGMVCARYRDVPNIVASLLQVSMFVTPIFWPLSALGRHGYIADYNPLYHAVQIVREPLLGHPSPLVSWLVMLGITIIGCGFTFFAFSKYRQRIVFFL